MDAKDDSLTEVINNCKSFEDAEANKKVLDQAVRNISKLDAGAEEETENAVAAVKYHKALCFNCGQLYNFRHRENCPAKGIICNVC